MGACLRGKMTEAGIIPAPATALVDPVATPAVDTAAVTSEPETAVGEPALDVATTEPVVESKPAVPENLIAATFGLLRAEPDGSVVIAGSGTPGTEVEVYSNGSLLGRATVETSGDWVLVPDQPIPPGGTEITLGEAGKDGRAEQSFVVAINEDKTSEPLVVASTPGAASEVLQGLDRPAAGTETQVAAADPVVPPPAEPAAAAAEPPPAATQQAPAVVEPAPASADPTAADAVAPSAVPDPATTDVAAATDAPATDILAASPAPADTDPAAEAPAVAAVDPPAADAPAALAADTPATVAVAAADPATPPAIVLEGTPPTIDAIEIEGDKTFFAGGGPEGATMRLYVDDTFVADAEVEDGRWLVEAGDVLGQASQRVRIDMLQPGTAKVASRAEVNFVVELPPEIEAPIVVAQNETQAAAVTADPAPAPEPEPIPAPEPTPGPEPAPVTEPAPQTTAAGADTADTEPAADKAVESANATAPMADPAEGDKAEADRPLAGADPGAPVDPTPASDTAASSTETSVSSATEPAPANAEPAPAVVGPAPAAEPAATPEPAPIVTEPVPSTDPAVAEAEIPTMVAVAVGDPNAERFASGKAIIRRGDNLWTIARRVYGEGIKYTAIYDANTGQIRDPDRIYPGQVFELPEGAQN